MKTFIISAAKGTARFFAVMLLYFGAWQLISMAVGSSLLLPSPVQTVGRMLELLSQGAVWGTIFSTLLRIVAGFFIGAAIGILLGTVTANSRIAAWLLTPVRTIIKSAPVSSFILILLVMTASDAIPVIISALMVTPILWAGTETGIKQLDPGLKEVARIYFSPAGGLLHITVPQLSEGLFAAGATGWGLAWKAAIAAEILAIPMNAVGSQMYFAKLYLESVDLFAWTMIIVLLSIITEQALLLVGRKR
ncbi:MAG: ABC transporter permease [Clostridia bacterium]|nr:ABC transporter permease [Clostridia bacterium]